MKRLLILSLTLLTTAAFADGPTKRTVVIRDGKVVSNVVDGVDVLTLDGDLLGGRRAHLGVRLTDIGPELREHYGAQRDSGVLVGAVEDGSPADKAGVRVGDIIVAVDGKEIEGAAELRRSLRDKKDGDSVRIEVLRNRARQTLVASVVEKEGPRILLPRDIEGLRTFDFNTPEWRGRIENLGDCATLQTRIKELETRLKDLEKKLQK
jgi:membrane-associated protease RseP (regulator of RpoE activity)